MTPLPECPDRGPADAAGRCACSHPRVVAPLGVGAGTCLRCPYVGGPRARPGPGTELAALLKSVGLSACLACQARAAEMDRNGVVWCRANRGTIAGWLREAAAGRTWAETVRAAGLSVVTGLAFRVDPGDVYGSLVDEACRRAEAKGPAGG